jgi:hypothetical protein
MGTQYQKMVETHNPQSCFLTSIYVYHDLALRIKNMYMGLAIYTFFEEVVMVIWM